MSEEREHEFGMEFSDPQIHLDVKDGEIVGASKRWHGESQEPIGCDCCGPPEIGTVKWTLEIPFVCEDDLIEEVRKMSQPPTFERKQR